MATADDVADGVIEDFLEVNGHETPESWDRSYNKKQCPECGGLHETAAAFCSVCGWRPE